MNHWLISGYWLATLTAMAAALVDANGMPLVVAITFGLLLAPEVVRIANEEE